MVQGVVRWWNKDTKDDLILPYSTPFEDIIYGIKLNEDKRFEYILATAIKGITKLNRNILRCWPTFHHPYPISIQKHPRYG